MPFHIRKKPNKSCYMVYKKKTNASKRRVYSKCTTLKNAKKQIRLLNAITYGKNFVPRNQGSPNNKTRKR